MRRRLGTVLLSLTFVVAAEVGAKGASQSPPVEGAKAAGPVAGADHPDFRQAVQTWLDDDDAGSLPVLADMARSGSTAARLLLSQIDREMPVLGETGWMKSLSKAERQALMRAPGTARFRKTWVRFLADEGHPLAQILVNSRDRTGFESVLGPLMDAGEVQLAGRMAFHFAPIFPEAFLEITGHPAFPDDSRFYRVACPLADAGFPGP